MTTMETPTQLPPSLTSDTPIDASLLELSVEEQRVIDEATAESKPKDKPADDAGDDAKPKEADKADVADPVAEVEDAPAADNLPDVGTKPEAFNGAPLPVPNLVTGEAPKFDELQAAIDKRRDELDKLYDDGDIKADEYRKRDRALSREETKLATEQAEYNANVKVQKAFLEQANQAAADQWKSDNTYFLAEDRNKNLFGTTLHLNAFQAAIDAVEVKRAADKQSVLGNRDLLEEARKLYMKTMGLSENTPLVVEETADAKLARLAKEAKDKGAPTRKGPDLDTVPKTVSAAPAAGADAGDDSSIDALFASNINDIENRMATMSRAEVDKLLRKLPGAAQVGTVD